MCWVEKMHGRTSTRRRVSLAASVHSFTVTLRSGVCCCDITLRFRARLILVTCPKCDHREAFWRQMQIRSADEPSTNF